MNKKQYHQQQRKQDDQALYGKQKEKAQEFKELPLDEIFMVLTRSGSEVFTQMVENTISRVVEEAVEKKLREAASGMMKGFEQQLKQVAEQAINQAQPEPSFDEEVDYEAEEEPEPVETELTGLSHLFQEDTNLSSIQSEKSKKERWTAEEDKYLKETVLNTMATGGTQKQAFRKASEVLGRKEAATQFRFNNKIRPFIRKELQEAKDTWQKLKQNL